MIAAIRQKGRCRKAVPFYSSNPNSKQGHVIQQSSEDSFQIRFPIPVDCDQ